MGIRRRPAAAIAAAAGALALAAPAQGATFAPVADTYVDESAPASNFGTLASLRTDASPVRTAYLRFNVQGVGSTTSARLRLFAETSNGSGFEVRSVSNTSWSETAVTFNNAPAYGPVVASSGPVTGGQWYSVDVSSLVTGDGPVSFAITSTSSTATRYSSREGVNPPQLIAPVDAGPTAFTITREGNTYRATATGVTYVGTLKQVLDPAVRDLDDSGGGTVTFASGVFDFGSDKLHVRGVSDLTFQGQGIDATTIQNVSSAAADTEPFDMGLTDRLAIRDMTVSAGGAFRSTSDAIDVDGGNGVVIERVKVTSSRARGIVFDGKDADAGTPRTADGNLIKDCVITGVPTDGIEFLAARESRVEGCTITDTGGHGIQFTKASPTAEQPNKKPNDNTATGNRVENAGQDGINVNGADRAQILGNSVLNSSDDVSSRDGIRIGTSDSIACNDNVVSNNTSGDNQAVPTQRYGLHIASSLCNRTVVSGNVFFGNRVAPIRDVGTGTIYR